MAAHTIPTVNCYKIPFQYNSWFDGGRIKSLYRLRNSAQWKQPYLTFPFINELVRTSGLE